MYRWLPIVARPLSPRQRQVAQLRAEGLTLCQIAERLGISESAAAQTSARVSRRLRLLSERERIAEIWPERGDDDAPATFG